MIVNLSIAPFTVKEATTKFCNVQEGKPLFPLLSIDADSYIVGAKIESRINFRVDDGVHNLQIGKYSALADDIVFLIDLNHNYHSVFQGHIGALEENSTNFEGEMRRKGQIIIENDCWIGHGATILSGVTIHNGAVIAAKSVVTKDVPPYAIVAGNPARIIKYRFSEEQIKKMLRIAWWDWPIDRLKACEESLHKPIVAFINEHLDAAEQKWHDVVPYDLERMLHGVRRCYLFFLDMNEPYPIYEKVIRQFVQRFNQYDAELILYISPNEHNFNLHIEHLLSVLHKYQEYDTYIHLCTDQVDDVSLFRVTDYYITNRAIDNIKRMCLAEVFNVQCISGVDSPIW